MADNRASIVITAKDETRSAINSAMGGLRSLQSFASSLPVVGTAIAAALSAGEFAGAINNAIKFAASLDDMAERTGASVESLSALARVAKIGGHDLAVVEMAAIRLAKGLAGADEEAKGAGHALEALGLKAEDFTNMDTGEQLKLLADRLATFKDGAGKTALIMDLLGRSGAQALPFLKDLSEEAVLNGRVTAEQARMAEAYEKNLNRLSATSGQYAKTLAMELLPVLNDIAQTMVDGTRQAGLFNGILSGLGTAIRGAFGKETSAIGRAREELDDLGRQLEATQKKIANFGTPKGSGQELKLLELTQYEAMLLRRRESLARQIDQMSAKEAGPSGDLGGYKSKPDSGKPDKAAAVTGGVNDLESRIAQRVGAAINDSDIARAREYELALQALDRLFFEGGLDAEYYASAIDKLSGSSDKAAQAQDRINELIAATPTAKLEESRKDMILLAEAFEAGRISAEQFNEAALTRLGMLDDKLKETDNFARDLGLTFSSAFEDAAINGKKLSDVLKGLAQDIARIVLRKTVTEPLGNAVSGWLRDALPSFGGGRAAGGPVYPGQYYLVGENGPEVLVPNVAGTVVPNGVGGGVVNNVSVVVNAEGGRASGDTASAAELGRRIEGAVRGVLLAEHRPGGLLAGA
jgi:hypothetical protein